MTIIKSTHTAPLGLPGGTFMRPGVPVEVADWRSMRHHGVVKQWLAAGVIEVVEASPEEAATDPLDHDGGGREGGSMPAQIDDELAELKAQAKELGIVVHWRWSREKIEAAINAKLAE